MIYESAVREIMNPSFEIPTQLDIMKEFYENEITLLNYTIEHNTVLSNVNESTDLAVINEEFNNKVINKIKTIIIQFIEFCKKMGRIVKLKLRDHIDNLKQKKDTLEAYLEKKTFSNIVFKYISPRFMDDFDRQIVSYISDIEKSYDVSRKIMSNSDSVDMEQINFIKNTIGSLKVETPNPNDYIKTDTIQKNNVSELINTINGWAKDAETYGKKVTDLLTEYTKNFKAYQNQFSRNPDEKVQAIASCVNLLANKCQMLSNVYTSTLNQYLSMNTKSVDKVLSQVKGKATTKPQAQPA